MFPEPIDGNTQDQEADSCPGVFRFADEGRDHKPSGNDNEIEEGVRKIPDPIVEPIAIMVRSKVVRSRLSSVMV